MRAKWKVGKTSLDALTSGGRNVPKRVAGKCCVREAGLQSVQWGFRAESSGLVRVFIPRLCYQVEPILVWLQSSGSSKHWNMCIQSVCVYERERTGVCIGCLIELHSTEPPEQNRQYMSMNYWSHGELFYYPPMYSFVLFTLLKTHANGENRSKCHNSLSQL